LFTREHGRIKAIAKGVRRTKSRFGAQAGTRKLCCRFTTLSGRTFDTITQVEAIENYGDVLSSDYQNWTVASAILEAAERFTQVPET
jgi:DNA repair protein RecO (recombination protein O)